MLVLKIIYIDDTTVELVCDRFNFDNDNFKFYVKNKPILIVPICSIIMVYCIPFDKGLI